MASYALKRESQTEKHYFITQIEGSGLLTESIGEPVGLVVVHYRHTQRVQSYQTQHSPVEALRLHHAPDEEAHSLFFPA